MQSGSITGLITVEGKPAPGLTVELRPRRYHIIENAKATTTTDEWGRYHFTDLAASHYWVKVVTREYISLDWRPYEGVGRNVSVADGEAVRNADLGLVPGGVVSGRVTDMDGNPVVGELVQLTEAEMQEPEVRPLPLYSEEFKTDRDGIYKIYGIPAGRYFVSVGHDLARLTGTIRDRYSFESTGRVSGSHYIEQTFHPGVTDKTNALAIDVAQGSELVAINIAVGKPLRAYMASGRLIDAETGEPVRNCRLHVSHRRGGGYNGAYIIGEEDRTDEEGNFKIHGLIPGRFFIAAAFTDSRFEDGANLYTNRVDFEIKDKDVTGIEIEAYRGLSITGSVVLEDSNNKAAIAKLSQLNLKAEAGERDERYSAIWREAEINGDGSFKFTGLRSGRIEISFGSSPMYKYFYLIRVEYPKDGDKKQIEVVPVQPLENGHILLRSKSLEGARIVLGYKNASIKCHVKVIGGKLPGDLRLMGRLSLSVGQGSWGTMPEVDANGNFTMDGLEPGNYTLSICDGVMNLTDVRTVIVTRNAETKVEFVINAKTIKRRN